MKLPYAFLIRRLCQHLVSRIDLKNTNTDTPLNEELKIICNKDMNNISLFEKCIPTIFLHEGGYVDDPSDSGGATNYGVSLLFLKNTKDLDGNGFLDGDINKDGIVDKLDSKSLTKDIAKDLYKKYFWNKHYEDIKDELLALHIFDMGVNSGNSRAVKMIQKIVGTSQDGIMGKITIGAINDFKGSLVESYIESRLNFYRIIAYKYPKNKKFLKGWINRVNNTKFLQ